MMLVKTYRKALLENPDWVEEEGLFKGADPRKGCKWKRKLWVKMARVKGFHGIDSHGSIVGRYSPEYMRLLNRKLWPSNIR